ncbi:MAG TPA: hypothetical protein VI522_08090, partial [Gammaproteobacteria bacterium]|nr:hypothetical protein [Gammaproteobacteria bacterium]
MKTYKEHIVACIDLLGFKVALESDKDDARIINMLQYFKSCERREQTIETSTNGGTHTAAFSPKIIAQSDQLEISFTDIPQPFDLSNAIFAIIQTVSQITITALKHGF